MSFSFISGNVLKNVNASYSKNSEGPPEDKQTKETVRASKGLFTKNVNISHHLLLIHDDLFKTHKPNPKPLTHMSFHRILKSVYMQDKNKYFVIIYLKGYSTLK